MRRAKSVWDELRAGRLDERGHDETELLGGRHAGIRRTMAWALRTRANWILRGFGRKPHVAPVIIKQVSLARSQEALRRVARYIARLGFEYPKLADLRVKKQGEPLPSARHRPLLSQETDRVARNEKLEPVVYDQDGNRISRDRVLETLERWGLLTDRENLTERGVEALRSGGPTALDAVAEADAFAEVQGRHIVVSVPMLGIHNKAVFEQIVRQFVKETFGAWDYPALVAVHVEHGKEIHGHILVGTSNLRTLDIEAIGGRTLKNANHERFFFDYDGIIADGLRLTLADVAQRFGMEVDASRREDRMELVFDILRGKEEIRPQPAKKQRGREADLPALEGLPPILRRLVQRAPIFTEEVAAQLVENFVVDQAQRAELMRPSAPVEPPTEHVPTMIERLRDWVSGEKRTSELPDDDEIAFNRFLKPLYDHAKQLRPFVEEPDRDRLMEALAMWVFLSIENRSFGRWTLLNAPYLLGPITSNAERLRADEMFLKLVDAVRFEDLEPLIYLPPKKRRPEDLLASSKKAGESVREILLSYGDMPWDQKFATEGRRRIARSYRQLAETMESAFAGEGQILLDAARISDIADQIAQLAILPVRDSDIEGIRAALDIPSRVARRTNDEGLRNAARMPPSNSKSKRDRGTDLDR